MTNAELVDLLRRARKVADAVVTDARSIAFAQWSPEQHEAEAVRDRIDAALAEGCPDCGHQYGQQEYCQGDGHAEPLDSATSVMEWCAVGDTWATAYPVDGVEMTVMRWVDGPWKWWTKLETSAQGTASTEAEAKSAAIRAARGVR